MEQLGLIGLDSPADLVARLRPPRHVWIMVPAGAPTDATVDAVVPELEAGDAAVVERIRPVFEALAPAPDRGWAHVGPAGAGHFTKMVHNGIEYGLMQAYAEGTWTCRHRSSPCP